MHLCTLNQNIFCTNMRMTLNKIWTINICTSVCLNGQSAITWTNLRGSFQIVKLFEKKKFLNLLLDFQTLYCNKELRYVEVYINVSKNKSLLKNQYTPEFLSSLILILILIQFLFTYISNSIFRIKEYMIQVYYIYRCKFKSKTSGSMFMEGI